MQGEHKQVLEDVKHFVPRIEKLFADVDGGKKFSKLNFASAYNQLEVTEETSKLFAWSTHKGICLVKRVPFGPKCAGRIFMKKAELQKTLQGA